MPKEKKIRQEKKKGLSDKELIEKYEAGKQDIENYLGKMLETPSPTAPPKKEKHR